MRLFISFIIPLLFLSDAFSQPGANDPVHQYPVKELKEDLQFFRGKLEKRHPNLYLYTAKNEMDAFFDSLSASVISPMNAEDFYNLLTLSNSRIKDGHTMLLPSENARNEFNKTAGFFPFYVLVKNRRIYINMNCSADTTAKNGAEILSINGRSAATISDFLLQRQIRDGNNKTYPEWIFSNYFKDYYSFSFGHPDLFRLTVQQKGKAPETVTVRAISQDSIKYFRRLRYANRILLSKEKQGITVKINDTLSAATLTVRSFDKQILKSEYSQNAGSAFKELFQLIREKKINSLILDLRNNQGGDFEAGRLLMSYLITTPAQYLQNSNEQQLIKPDDYAFKGRLLILINGGSFSNSGIVSSCLQAAGRGIFIGEETGGSKTVLSGNAADFILPNTGIMAEITSKKYIIRNADNDGHGVMPDYPVTEQIDDIISGNDRAMMMALSLLKKE